MPETSFDIFKFEVSSEWLESTDLYFDIDDLPCTQPTWWREIEVGVAFKAQLVCYESPGPFALQPITANTTLGEVMYSMAETLDDENTREFLTLADEDESDEEEDSSELTAR